MAFSLLVNIMNACFFARQSGGGRGGGVGYVKNLAVRAAPKSMRTHATLTAHCSH